MGVPFARHFAGCGKGWAFGSMVGADIADFLPLSQG
jgi:hypothetical protein